MKRRTARDRVFVAYTQFRNALHRDPTASDIAKVLGVQPEAVRIHLSALRHEGRIPPYQNLRHITPGTDRQTLRRHDEYVTKKLDMLRLEIESILKSKVLPDKHPAMKAIAHVKWMLDDERKTCERIRANIVSRLRTPRRSRK